MDIDIQDEVTMKNFGPISRRDLTCEIIKEMPYPMRVEKKTNCPEQEYNSQVTITKSIFFLGTSFINRKGNGGKSRQALLRQICQFWQAASVM